ncbi:excisionase family protein [Silvania hatchlandensis]|uniref:Excisionase family protein n=1 Tax=Silvania hatchlandensis TaxID=2926469 RepID=A0A9J6Q7D9_9ENTR|nr:excisionase family protein [Silvania hatchlandensis]MCU6666131.1 excisionase family protein [Silvania hatchlandensis]
MAEVIYMVADPGEWVSESQIMALKGLKEGTLKNARRTTFLEGREYKHVAADGNPFDNSPCFYNIKAIDRWIERQAPARPSRKTAAK